MADEDLSFDNQKSTLPLSLDADLSFDNQEMATKSISDTPPTHYTVKIQLFSLLSTNNVEKYESAEFEAGGYKWKLVMYPNGNKNKNINDHLSLYLAMAEASNSLRPGWEIHAVFRLFLLNQNMDNYYVVQDTYGRGKRFHRMKLEWGFDQFIPLKIFKDASSGYLLNDTCVLGAEVFVQKEQCSWKGERLSMVKDAITFKHTWKLDNFSKLYPSCCDSEPFNAGDTKWKIQLYPKGRGVGSGTHISLLLALAEPLAVLAGSKVFASFTLRVLAQVHDNDLCGKANYWFSPTKQEWGWNRFMTLSYFNQQNMGFLRNDSCTLEAEVTVLGVANPF